ncbi:MAG: hypothetical protein CVU11_12835 [Bacteroidetes bacterium HGW-Bacteroidetes-6]|jgi:hypothetical protein|nr:MAG: hypothetical protein CVU11_12835 [Bacteroidetes bacterium HGW-Bacteroidetes-6]
MNRKTTPKVKDGRVQKKNRHEITPNYWDYRQDTLQVAIESPGKGFRHFLKKRDIVRFLEILPNWKEIDIELDAILLAKGGGSDGWYNNGVIGICAWEKNKTCSLDKEYFNAHLELFKRLELDYEIKKESVVCHFTESQIIAYQLLHVLLHEIGHHHDRINTKSKNRTARGEKYAEEWFDPESPKSNEFIWP